MVSHKCNKEKEIERLATNGDWLMQNLKDVKDQINSMNNKIDTLTNILTSGDGKINVLNKAVFNPDGLINQVRDIRQEINQFKGTYIVIKWVAGVVVLNVIGTLFLTINLFISKFMS